MRTTNLINFIKYHNAVPISISLAVLLTAGAMAASPDVQEVFVTSDQKVISVDNAEILAAHISDHKFNLEIENVAEDEERYYVDYSFETFVLKNYVWQKQRVARQLATEKVVLAGGDLGEYVAKQLKEVIDFERSYLTDTQQIEKKNGVTEKVVATTYSGLIGRFFDEKKETFAGYKPVVEKMEAPEEIITVAVPEGGLTQPEDPEQQENLITEEYIKILVQQVLAEELNNGGPSVTGDETAIGDTGRDLNENEEPIDEIESGSEEALLPDVPSSSNDGESGIEESDMVDMESGDAVNGTENPLGEELPGNEDVTPEGNGEVLPIVDQVPVEPDIPEALPAVSDGNSEDAVPNPEPEIPADQVSKEVGETSGQPQAAAE